MNNKESKLCITVYIKSKDEKTEKLLTNMDVFKYPVYDRKIYAIDNTDTLTLIKVLIFVLLIT